MFDHIIIFLSFIYAMAMTKLLSSASDIVSARRRVRFSALYVLWLFVAALGLIVVWLGDRTLLMDLKVWRAPDFALVLSSAVIQYFFCSLIAIKVEPEGMVDLAAYMDQERPAIFSVAAVLDVVVLFTNYFESPHTHGQSSSTWIVADLLVLPILASAVVAGWARPRWAQWAAALVALVMELAFFGPLTIGR